MVSGSGGVVGKIWRVVGIGVVRNVFVVRGCQGGAGSGQEGWLS